MAFDQSTRNRLQKLVNDCRKLLSEEFSIQLQQTYGIDPHSGEVAGLDRLTHLSDRDRQTAQLLRDTLAHYLAVDADDKAHRIAAIDRIIREQAFTVLNRLAALLMMEARGLLAAAVVSQGQQSQAFELYKMVSGSSLGETGEAYRTFLFSLFDEFAIDLPALFDRYAAQGRLFPREPALLEVLDALNHHGIQSLWGEDETIGWIYQYFNSKEERKAMRDASQAPRNSRELAVRNQFFTPRYVVEFLVDNTLGRMWFNATGGKSELRDRCQYLLVKPEEQPQASARLRDPRTLKLLDPACGSMHFGLYAFDLFLQLYEEAWDWEQGRGPGALDVSTQPNAGLLPLCQTYADREAYQRDVPRLIIEHNIYGVDIDPRAAQIASLALWLRAQRAWHDAGVKAQQRPDVGRGHVVAAVAPPAERDLRQQFTSALDKCDAELFDKTLQLLKGLPELGVLLQVERELPSLIRRIFVSSGTGLFAAEEQESWEQAESRLRMALFEFAQAAKSTYQGRLFAQDALEGLRLIDLCREVFDVVLMNPPFGELAAATKKYVVDSYPRSKNDLYAIFIERGLSLMRSAGYLGAITNKTGFFLQTFEDWRRLISTDANQLTTAVDLGFGVLDTAMVETMMYTISGSHHEGSSSTDFIRLTHENDKHSMLDGAVREIRQGVLPGGLAWRRNVEEFSGIPNNPLCYWASKEFIELFRARKAFAPKYGHIYQGIATGDNFRFLRCRWEVSVDRISQGVWATYAKGGASRRWLSDFSLVILWEKDGAEIKANAKQCYGSASRTIKNESTFFKPGITYTQVTVKGFFARTLPAGCVFDMKGPSVQFSGGESLDGLAVFASTPFRALAKLVTDCRQWHPTSLMELPYPEFSGAEKRSLAELAGSLIKQARFSLFTDEISSFFLWPSKSHAKFDDRDTDESESQIDEIVARSYGIDLTEFLELDELLSATISDSNEDDEDLNEEERSPVQDVISYAVGVAFGRFDWRLATGERAAPPESEPFEQLPAKSPGMLPDGAIPFHQHTGVLVDDQGHPHDLARLVEQVLETVDASVTENVCRWLQKDFFAFHLKRYSKSRRKAPIYWPLATASGSYTLWLYYPSLSDQTLFTAINDFVDPKLEDVRKELQALRDKGTGRNQQDEKRLEALASLDHELADLRDSLLEIAPSYRPNHDDGVQITAAPLWKLFRHKPWQKVLKDTWAKLEKGDYDWAHLAMNYWPERVCDKCVTDKSLAIAHNLEHLYIEPEVAPKKARGRAKKQDV